jgi:cytochrome c oxidase subunit 2
MRIPIHFTPTKVGHYQINCAQLCGNSHANMSRGMLVVQTQKEFDEWLATKPTAGTSSQSFE